MSNLTLAGYFKPYVKHDGEPVTIDEIWATANRVLSGAKLQAFQFRYLDDGTVGYTYSYIAEIQGVAPSTVSARVLAALGQVRRALKLVMPEEALKLMMERFVFLAAFVVPATEEAADHKYELFIVAQSMKEALAMAQKHLEENGHLLFGIGMQTPLNVLEVVR